MENKLRFWRKKRQLTQEQLAELAELSSATICRIECGKGFFSAASLERTAAALGVQPRDIVHDGVAEDDPEAAEAQAIVRKVPKRERERLLTIMRAFLN